MSRKSPRITVGLLESAFHGIAIVLAIAPPSNTPADFPHTHGTTVDFIVPDREVACGGGLRFVRTQITYASSRRRAVRDGIQARRESRIDAV